MTTTDSHNENNLDEVVADYVRAIEAGSSPDREALLAQYPDLADDLRDFFTHRDRMQKLLDPLRSAAARILNVRCPHCHNAIELVDHAQVTSLSCPTCGSDFSLVADGSAGGFPRGIQKIGQFQLVEQVGVGQFGTVWKARDLTLERTVAIKIPRSSGLSEQETEMFLRDARLAAQLHHPNIVGVHEVGKHENVIYIVSDFIQGATLSEWIKARRLTLRQAVSLCAKVARALDHAHEAGVIHRDLKPGNVMMDLTGEPHIVDFGLAKRVSGEITMTIEGQILGTPAYMSPEQARGEGHHVDRRADIYSLGVVLFELLTGELPFRGEKQMLLVQIIRDVPPSPRKLNAKVPRDVETICLKCLEKEPHQRYSTAADFAEDCERFLDGSPVVARPVSRVIRGWRWCRRKPWIAGLSAIVAALLVLIAVVSNVGYWNTRSALEIAEERTEIIEQNLYYSEMNRAALAATEVDGLGIVRGLLDKWAPTVTTIDRRGWEWYYLESLLHQEVATLQSEGSESPVGTLAFSPDGSRLASGGSDWILRVWSRDGHVLHTLDDHDGRISCVAWNPDGTLLASASIDGSVRLWNADSGTTLKTLQHIGPVDAVSFSGDGKRLATTSISNPDETLPLSIITLWSADTGEKEKEFPPRSLHFEYLKWNPKQPQIAIGSQFGQVDILNADNGKVLQTLTGTIVDWNRSGQNLLTGRWHDVNVWNAVENQQIAAFKTSFLTASAFSPDGNWVCYTSGYKTVSISHISTEQVGPTFRGHLNRVASLCWHPNGRRIATGGGDGEIKIWESNSRSEFYPGARAISWNPDGTRYASVAIDRVVIVDPSTNKVEHTWKHHVGGIFSVAWSPDGTRVASMGYDGEVRVCSAVDGTLISSIQSKLPFRGGGSRLPTVLSWSPDSQRLAFPQTEQSVRIIAAETATPLHDLNLQAGQLRSLSWSPDGSSLLTGGRDAAIEIWNPQNGKTINTVIPGAGTAAICWSPDGTHFATAESDTNIRIRDAVTGEFIHVLSGHATFVHTVSWSPDSQRIASGDETGSVRIWDANTGQQTLTLNYPGGVPMVAWNPDSKSIAAVGFGGGAAVRIWSSVVEKSSRELW